MPAHARGWVQVEVSRAVWLSADLDDSYSSRLTAKLLNSTVRPVHIVWDPIDGSIVQMLSAWTTAPYRAIPMDGRRGSVLIMVTGKPETPFTQYGCKGLSDLMAWLRAIGVPDTCPSGPPALKPQDIGQTAGHYLRVGAIDCGRLFRS